MLKEDKEFTIKIIDVLEILYYAVDDYKAVYKDKIGEDLDKSWNEIAEDSIFEEMELLLESVVSKMRRYDKSFKEVIEEDRRLVEDM